MAGAKVIKVILEELATRAKAGDTLAQGGINAWHGSPHDFDQFKMSQIGTGEGAQAYGHGLYFAENKSVAEGYREALTEPFLVDGKPISNMTNDYAEMTLLNANFDIDKAISAAEGHLGDLDLSTSIGKIKSKGINKGLDKLKGIKSRDSIKQQKGSLFNVNIDATPDELLDWDKPLSEQPEKVRTKLLGLTEKYPDLFDQDSIKILKGDTEGATHFGELWGDMTGNQLHGKLEDVSSRYPGTDFGDPGSPSAVASTLNDIGIKGIQYDDAMSRGNWTVTPPDETVAGDWMAKDSSSPMSKGAHFDTEQEAIAHMEKAGAKTKNYVIFDDKLIDIAKKYGVTLPVAATMMQTEEAEAGVVSKTAGKLSDLAMDTASRMQRAKEQGFDIDNPVFHGTDAGDITAFKNIQNRAGQGKPVFMSPTPALANRFSDAGEIGGGEVVFPLMTRVQNTFDFRNPDHINQIKHFVSAGDLKRIRNGEWRQIENSETIEAIKGFGFDSFNVMEGSVSKAFAEADRAKSRIFPDTAEGKKAGRAFFKDKVQEWNNKSGKNSLKPEIKTTSDGFTIEYQGGEFKTAGERAEGSAGVNLAVFDTSNIRSINAAFDPAKRESSDLLAGIGALGAGTTAALFTPEQNKAMAGQLVSMGIEDVGSITADEFPFLQQAGDFIEKWSQLPIGGSPVEGLADYLRGFGDDADTLKKAERSFFAALDIMP